MKGFCLKFQNFLLVVIFFALSLQAYSQGPRGEAQGKSSMIVGTWKLNLAKSKYGPGSQPPRTMIQKHEQVGDGWKYIEERVDADGKEHYYTYIANFDGKEYPVKLTKSGKDTGRYVTLMQIDPYTFYIIGRDPPPGTLRPGGGTVIYKHVVSSDGKTKTSTTIGPKGVGDTIQVYDRVQ